MNAEALIGKVLGTCTLQQLIGRGGLGAVFLAQQSRPRRRVAVKVLFPNAPLTANQQVAFFERFLRETDAAASLIHPNIIPVHEYGEQDGLAYLVMSYLSGGSLREVLEREGRLPLAQIMLYLDQMAAALDVAHARGIIHRDMKPSNILLTPEGRLVLSDFGLVKVISEGQPEQARITAIGAPADTADYMAPEQVVGGREIDARADIYSLGCILYHMVTGTAPFSGDTPMQVGMQHMNAQPPSPRALRPDLPEGAEQVIVRALAKQPDERYASVHDLALAFREALTAAGVSLGEATKTSAGALMQNGSDSRVFKRRGLFDPMWQQNSPSQGGSAADQQNAAAAGMNAATPAAAAQSVVPATPRPLEARHDLVAKTSMTLPGFLPPEDGQGNGNGAGVGFRFGKTSLLSSAGIEGLEPTQQLANNQQGMRQERSSEPGWSPASNSGEGVPLMQPSPKAGNSWQNQLAPQWNQPNQQNSTQGAQNVPGMPNTFPGFDQQQYGSNPSGILGLSPGGGGAARGQSGTLMNAPANMQGGTGLLPPSTGSLGKTSLLAPIGEIANPETGSTTSMLRLTQPAKMVKIPVAGQPGKYVTAMLPSLENPPADEDDTLDTSLKGRMKRGMHNAVLIILILAVLVGAGGGLTWLVLGGAKSYQGNHELTNDEVNATVTAQVQATATSVANIILVDPLDQKYRDWPDGSNGGVTTSFKDGAYHVKKSNEQPAMIALPGITLPDSFEYSLTTKMISGPRDNPYNEYGIIFRVQTNKDGSQYEKFYLFDIRNTDDSPKYQLWLFDSTRGDGESAWGEPLKEWDPGKEFNKQDKKENILKVVAQKDKYTFYVNGKKIGDFTEKSLKNGLFGMLVYLDAEVAFSKLEVRKR
ncbi:serine/threonine protein kinase [Thermosporothrix hazakensis]|jgi:serine/threonine protein kinase|uniref:non-specific serine/threonine protein kinase n=1 Tax=Thermosporothrix hazakensis TaxID=644383 RepID=A0A326UCG2_THEHA|nr:serine/threonine-protein kinase [Thermosporothrix hazakensis]PZW26366.1 serine/threonine protein kinase [Thermosporothrix hazakensis]GCE48682.1 hypothetical protein KTH_35510 [Thermosporothrix hazakensis]